MSPVDGTTADVHVSASADKVNSTSGFRATVIAQCGSSAAHIHLHHFDAAPGTLVETARVEG